MVKALSDDTQDGPKKVPSKDSLKAFPVFDIEDPSDFTEAGVDENEQEDIDSGEPVVVSQISWEGRSRRKMLWVQEQERPLQFWKSSMTKRAPYIIGSVKPWTLIGCTLIADSLPHTCRYRIL